MSLMTPNEKPVFGSSFVINNWFRFTIPGMKKILRQYRFDRVDFLWFDSLVQHFWLDILDHDKAILRVSDRFEAFKKIGKKKGPVKFNHQVHSNIDKDKFPCRFCHHEGRPDDSCSKCHKGTKGKKAIHKNCIGCHKNMKKAPLSVQRATKNDYFFFR